MSARGREDDEAGDPGLGRVLAFSDGVFAIAITLLVLGLNVPRGLSASELHRSLRQDTLPELGIAALSFAVIGLFWLSHRRVFAQVLRIDGMLLLLNLVFLGPVVLMPFSSQLLSRYGADRVAVACYAATIGLAALLELWIWLHASRRRRLVAASLSRADVLATAYRAAYTAVVFLASIPVSLVSVTAAKYAWLALPVLFRLRRWIGAGRAEPAG
jgi:uncharacterized membrane protein